jgi:hypothetical protein
VIDLETAFICSETECFADDKLISELEMPVKRSSTTAGSIIVAALEWFPRGCRKCGRIRFDPLTFPKSRIPDRSPYPNHVNQSERQYVAMMISHIQIDDLG